MIGGNRGTGNSDERESQVEDDTWFCIHCHKQYIDPFTEEWRQCTQCPEWFHEDCRNGFSV